MTASLHSAGNAARRRMHIFRVASPAHLAARGAPTDRAAHRPRQAWPLPPRADDGQAIRATRRQVAGRLLYWAYAFAYFAARRLGTRLWNPRAAQRPAGVLLRETLERMGGTFVKLGQQLSTRMDLLPLEVCDELAKMLDAMPPFPVAQAIAAIERATGKALGATFSTFDPQPLGSASVACVYHAILRSGREVAVKVRRPGIERLFAADLSALDLLCRLAERLTLLRPGLTAGLRGELRSMLMEELDFRSEARYQEMFRRQADRDGQSVSAPRVYGQLCGPGVLVSEFVHGVWLQDLVAAVERDDRRALAHYAGLHIDPAAVSRNLFQTLYWANFENLFYHADPHPKNILVQPHNQLIFVDFGACGPSMHRNRRNLAELFRRQAQRDVAGVADVFANMLAPLPALDLDALYRDGETLTARWQYGFESKHPEWWERSTAGLWIGMFELTRRYNIPVTVDTVRLVRSSLLYDTIAARLSSTIDMRVEFERYVRAAQARARRRRRRAFPDRAERAARFAQIAAALTRGRFALEQFADQPLVDTTPAAAHWARRLTAVVQLAVAAGALAAAATLSGEPLAVVVADLAARPLSWGVVGLLAWHTWRRVRRPRAANAAAGMSS